MPETWVIWLKQKDLQVPHKGTWRRFPWGRFFLGNVEKYVAKKKRNVTNTSRFLGKDNKKGNLEKNLELVFKHSHSFLDRERAFELRKSVF